MAYLEAWLRVRPNDGEFLSVLGAQYVRTGRLAEAEAMVARMRALHDKTLDREALLLDIAIREQRAYALQPNDPQRAAMLVDLRGLLKQALDYRWTAAELEMLGAKSRGLDQGAIAIQFYQRLAKQDVARATQWQARTAEIALGVGEYRAAAAANFAAQATATSRDEQRRYFIAGLKALQAGNLLDDAMTEAQRRVGPLIDDTETLRFLTRLAMACNRPDLADQYARRLLRLSWHQAGRALPWRRVSHVMTGHSPAGLSRCQALQTWCSWMAGKAWRVASATLRAFARWRMGRTRQTMLRRLQNRRAHRPSHAGSPRSMRKTTTSHSRFSWAAAI